ncbi:sister chromatid cohesion protein PDS5 homolog A isoform X2 [Phoenix dactylifera]|uniref:Sister chromatid cohesion protein PDS5 homolog A isoform X2 n=1 Tax=Phoenix dactylifera TaxID=42345 RepID=A0A8B7CSI6_PHODC|nr:sister chromatid cohesion protein PDS5 homolog A isoform X2 [Phoenix dactylifera]
MAQKLQQQLRDVGSKLENPPASKDALARLLKQAANCLSEIDQSPLPSMLDSMRPCLNAIAKQELLKHQDREVKVLVATCICEITRITAPEAPYSDDVLRDIFHLIVSTFSGLGDINSPSFGRRVVILETLARYRSCVVMLDLECNDLIYEMFGTFFSVVSDDHPQNVLTSMQTIMSLIFDESEDIQDNLLSTILSALGRKRNDYSMAARRLAMNVIEHCARKLEPCIMQFLVSSLSGDNSYLNKSLDHHEVIYDIYQCAPQILTGITPYITGELLTDKLDVRLKAVQLLGDLFALPGVSISESFQPLFSEFLKRLTDRVVEVRISVIEHLKHCLISNPSRPEAPQIIKALSDRLLDYDGNVRKQVVSAVYDVACHSLKIIPAEIARLVAERLRDKSLSVKRYTMERLADLYKLNCIKSSESSIDIEDFEWIPGKILRCLYDKDFRLETIELILCGSLFPSEFSIKDKVKHWVTIFSRFDKVEVKALEQVLLQKHRLQQELQKYLSLRQTHQEDAPDLQKRISGSFRIMSRLFSDPAKAEESFVTLNQLKDVNIWKILASLLDPSTSFCQAWSYRDELLKILGERHPLYDFMGMLSIKCSYLLFNKEYVKEILSETAAQQSVGNTRLVSSCMNLLTVISSFSPLLLAGCEEDLVCLLKEDNEIIKEGITHVLARAGGIIREQLALTSSSVDLLLERLCLEGTRKQAKYSVQALAAITKDDGLKSLSVLYKRLVDMLEEKRHLPAILQSLGCIAQTALPVFETREEEIVGFIRSKILESSNMDDGVSTQTTEWSERSEFCLLKIFGIKTLVKSYLPAKDAHLRPGIEKLVEILKNILSFGDISDNIESSAADKAHLKLASAKAVLRLSRHWDHKIPVDVFYMTLRMPQDIHPQSRKLFLNKVHQYIKERLLDAKYACSFLLNINGYHTPEYEECKQNLLEVVQVCQQLKVRQLSMQCEMNMLVAYPEYILAYLVHALAHHPSCPNIEECMDVQAFEPTYWRLHLFLSTLLHGDEGQQSGSVSNKKKESFTAIVSILHSIKSSEDVVDGAKSKTLHAICDLGLAIAKRLVQDPTDISVISEVPLPCMLYKLVEKNKDVSSVDADEQSWLGGESALAHFEALKIENKEMIDSGAAKDVMALEGSDKDGDEVPLGEMMKILKSQGPKKRKTIKRNTSPFDIKKMEHEFDVLGVVREINLDNLERAQNMETGTKDPEYFGSRQTSKINNNEKVTVFGKRKRDKTTIEVAVPTPKRKRSVSVQRSHSAKGHKGSREIPSSHSIEMDEKTHIPLEQKLFTDKGLTESTDSDLLASCLPMVKSSSSRNGKKDADGLHVEKLISNDQKESSSPVDSNKKSSQPKSLLGSIKKRKVRSIAGLGKCSSHSNELSDSELVGSRIKVWWPLDKQFYEGVVQSYDPGKKKHEILYDDGDVELLHLAKEKWELISNGCVPKKRSKSKHTSPHEELSPEKTDDKTNQADSKQKKNSMKKKSTPRKRKVNNRKRVSESNVNADTNDVDSRGDSDLSSVPPPSGSDVDDANSDRLEGKEHPMLEVGKKTEVGFEEDSEESMEEGKQDFSSLDGKGDSDDEPLSAWKQGAGKAT